MLWRFGGSRQLSAVKALLSAGLTANASSTVSSVGCGFPSSCVFFSVPHRVVGTKSKMSSDEESGDKLQDVAMKKALSNQVLTPKEKKSIEKIYQKKSQLEHILLRPDTYIGSVETVTQEMWVYDTLEKKMVFREVKFVPGLYKIFDEILVNAADNKQRDKGMSTIKIDINTEKNQISVWNNGQGIPVVEHKDEKMYVPTMIFGHLLTSSNYNDDEKKVTGGRNGYGAKLCNIFSKKFVVETASKEYKKKFKQEWSKNMSHAGDPKIEAFSGEDYTKIMFEPDLAKFRMTVLDKDIVQIMSRRAFDIAGTTGGVKVFLNGEKLPITNFKQYVELYTTDNTDEMGNPLKVNYEKCGDRWEVAVTTSETGFQQVSFVNSIATTKGGSHQEHVTSQLIKAMGDVLKKKNKTGTDIKPHAIKSHLWVFVNCLIENPTFDSQTKENMTLQIKSFGSKCQLPEAFIGKILKSGVVEQILAFAKAKAETQLGKKIHGAKHAKLKGLPKLEDANDAGTKNSLDCTLILTEGDSAKTLAVSGFSVVGRDKFGVYPLRGKLLNVREATPKQLMENAEINAIVKIMGLQYKRKYQTDVDLKTLRYGRLMIMTDQDQDGSHIKGLLINFIHHNWPSLLRHAFLEEFITPIVKAKKKGAVENFYSLPELEEWKAKLPENELKKYDIKYYKGLGTSDSNEAKEYFSDMTRHRIRFQYNGHEDDDAIDLAFAKNKADARKDWLTRGMEERKQRRDAGLGEMYLYTKTTRSVTYKKFVDEELILFSNMDNERSIPSLVDGLKPGQRKVLYTCFKRNDKKEIKVAQLAGSVAEHSAYHHGEQSLMSTIIGLAQDYVGSNNINILMPHGQFGTRLQGGKDAASPRYIFTKLSPLARIIFHPHDSPSLKYLNEDNQKIEPEWYIPVLPMVLINGAEGIGTGWMTKIPNYNPLDIVSNLRALLRGEELKPMIPWYRGYRGEVMPLDEIRYISNGEVAILDDDNSIEISELPVRTWTQNYKETVIEPMLNGTEKNGKNTPPQISDYREYHTDTTVRFVVTMLPDKFDEFRRDGFHKVFKLQSTINMTSMVLFDRNGVIKKYDSVNDIMKEFFCLRMERYQIRKEYLVGMLTAEALRLKNQARFIGEKIDGKIKIENVKRKEMIAACDNARPPYDSDPVKAWKKSTGAVEDEPAVPAEEEDNAKKAGKADSDSDFDYILGMPLWSLTQERYQELMKRRDDKIEEVEVLKLKSPADLYRADLDEFEARYNGLEETEKENPAPTTSGKGSPKKPRGKGKKRRGAAGNADTIPCPTGVRVEPTIDVETIAKFEKAKELKERKAAGEPSTKRVRKVKDPAAAPAKKEKETKEKDSEEEKSGKKFKQTTLDIKVEKKPKRKAADSDDESSFHSSEMSSDEEEELVLSSDSDAAPPKKPAAPKRKRDISPEMEEENIDTNVGRKKTTAAVTKKKVAVVHATDDEEEGVKPGQLPAGGAPAAKKEVKKPVVMKSTKIISLFSSDEEEEPVKVVKKPVVKKEAPKPVKRALSESAEDEDVIVPRARAARVAAAKKFVFQDSGSETNDDDDYVMDISS